jgi:hypothetical protein
VAPGNKRSAIAAAVIMATAPLAWVAGIWLSGLEGSRGFFGPGPLIADANLILEVLIVAGVSYGFVLARRGNIDAHQVNQSTWVALNLGLIALVMAGSMQDVKIGKGADLADWRIGVTWAHAAVGTLTAAAGLWIVLQMNGVLPARLHVAAWRQLMRAALAGYWLTALLGFVTYYFWYVA